MTGINKERYLENYMDVVYSELPLVIIFGSLLLALENIPAFPVAQW